MYDYFGLLNVIEADSYQYTILLAKSCVDGPWLFGVSAFARFPLDCIAFVSLRLISLSRKGVVVVLGQIRCAFFSGCDRKNLESMRIYNYARIISFRQRAAYCKRSLYCPLLWNVSACCLLVFVSLFTTEYVTFYCHFSALFLSIAFCVFSVLPLRILTAESDLFLNYAAPSTFSLLAFFFLFFSFVFSQPFICDEFWQATEYGWLQRESLVLSWRRLDRSLLQGAYYVNLWSYWWCLSCYVPYAFRTVLCLSTSGCFETGRIALWPNRFRTDDGVGLR